MSLPFDRMCRTCLSTESGLLIESNSISASNQLSPSISEMLKAITSVEIINNDGLPGKVCLSCISEINRAFSFKIKCENSDFTLRQYLLQQVNEQQNNNQITETDKTILPSSTTTTTATTTAATATTTISKATKSVEAKIAKIEDEIKFECNELEDDADDDDEVDEDDNTKTLITFKELTKNNEEKISEKYYDNEKLENLENQRKSLIDDDNNITDDAHDVDDHDDDDRVSLIFADESDFDGEENHNQQHVELEGEPEEDQAIFSIETNQVGDDEQDDRLSPSTTIAERVQNDNDENLNKDLSGEILLECAICNKKFEDHTEFQYHAEYCTIENDTMLLNSGRSLSSNDNNDTLYKTDETSGNQDKEKKDTKKILKCPHCPVDFVHPKNLYKHVKKCHERKNFNGEILDEMLSLEDSKDTTGTICTKKIVITKGDDNMEISEEVINLVEEVKHQPAELPQCPYKCIQCGAGFAKEKSLNYHFKLNKCTQKQFECLICRRVFITQRNLVHHMKTHINIKCTKCDKTFSEQDKLKAHDDKEHNGIVKNQCSLCGKVFTMLSTLKDHLRTHSGEKPFLCSICGKGFTQSTNLKQHLMRHSKIKPYKCEQCENSFVSKGELNAHIRKHTGDHPFICSTCGAGFTTSSSLVKHRRIHTGERPYACEFCPMRFSALGTLKNHRRTHTGEKPFICKYCNRAFAQKSDCVTHMRTHTKEKPYNCTRCDATFTKSSALKLHLQNHCKEGVQNAKNAIIQKIPVQGLRKSKRVQNSNNSASAMHIDVYEIPPNAEIYQTSDELSEEIL